MKTTHTRVAIVGATGYTGGELFRLLSQHPELSITLVAASEKSSGQPFATVFPHLTSLTTLSLEQADPKTIASQADVIFLALPHTQALHLTATLLELNRLVIDLSADYRLDRSSVYEQCYQVAHPFPSLLEEAVYGLPELYRSAIPKARLIAVPGCYPTAAILQLAPLLAQDLVDPTSMIIDAKSGISGAGRGASLPYHFPEAHESIHAYKIGAHRHQPEIEQELQKVALSRIPKHSQDSAVGLSIAFTPHLVPMNRGILSTAYAKVKRTIPSDEWTAVYENYYKEEPFIRVFSHPHDVNPRHIRGSNYCDVGIAHDPRSGQLVSVCAIDNLVKGAAGQAIQAMNIRLGFPETLGLSMPGVFP